MNLRDYYLNVFRGDVEKIRFRRGSEVTNPSDFFFDREEWKNAVQLMEDNETKAYFIFSMCITVAPDQTMYTYYQKHYGDFRRLTRYPKFGWCGLGPHNENPLLLIQYAIEDNAVDSNYIGRMSKDAAELFVDEIFDFFVNHMPEVDPKEFIENFVNDNNVATISSQSNLVKTFIDYIREYVNRL